MKKKILLVLASVLLLAGCKEVKLDNGENAIVTFKEGGISANDLYEDLKSTYGAQKVMDLIDTYLLDKLYDETTDEKNYIKQNLKTVEDSAKSMNADLDLYLTYYYGVSNKDAFKEYLRLNYRRDLWKNDYAKETVTEKQINEYYESEVYGDIEASQILLTVDVKEDATDDEKKEAEDKVLKEAKDIIQKLKDGGDFASLAKEFSKDEATASNGGSLGKINVGDADSEVLEALRNLKDGSYTTSPIKTSNGYYVLYRTSQDEKPELDEEMTDAIKSTVGTQIAAESDFQVKALEALREKNEMKFEDTDLEKDFESLMNRYKQQNAN